MNSAANHSQNQRQYSQSRRPSTIAELAARALDNLWDEKRELKYYLRVAEKYRREAKSFTRQGDLESAFIEFAKAATLVLEKLPTHRDYNTLLTDAQRHNLSLNGQEILDSLGDLKPMLVDRYEKWKSQHPETNDGNYAPGAQPLNQISNTPSRRPEDDRRSRSRGREAAQAQLNEELALWQKQREDQMRRDEEERAQGRGSHRDRRRDAAVAAARQAATKTQTPAADHNIGRSQSQSRGHGTQNTFVHVEGQRPVVDDRQRREGERHWPTEAEKQQQAQEAQRYWKAELERRQSQTDYQRQGEAERLKQADAERQRGELERQRQADIERQRQEAEKQQYEERQRAEVERQRQAEAERQRQADAERQRQADAENHRRQQEEMRLREEEIKRKRKEEQDGIARRRQEADDAARQVRQHIAVNNAPHSVSYPTLGASPAPSTYPTYPTTPTAPTPNAAVSPYYPRHPVPISYPNPGNVRAPMALKSRPPSILDSSPVIMPLENPTKYEGDSTDSESVRLFQIRRTGQHKQVIDNSKTPTRAPPRNHPYPPPVTTTSPPPVEGGRIMYPQLMSPHQKKQGYYPSLNSMFTPQDQPNSAAPSVLFGSTKSGEIRDLQHTPNAQPSTQIYAMPNYQPHQYQQQQGWDQQEQQQRQRQYSYPGPSRPPPPIPAPPLTPQIADRITKPSDGTTTPALKTVNMPRECLPRFLAIAKVNTAMNKETCGLLLGKDKGTKYAVTTLLIPKQHATSDTCTMDEEELVLQFTVERSLITLGWIHTHPSQSCFMSSVDLHTHSAFQRMLPESFAVVCAPKSTPNFGIFRLTDPPGLKTVLECNATEAFHPHPDIPIYTDADKGHVQMKDTSIEIVDLR